MAYVFFVADKVVRNYNFWSLGTDKPNIATLSTNQIPDIFFVSDIFIISVLFVSFHKA